VTLQGSQRHWLRVPTTLYLAALQSLTELTQAKLSPMLSTKSNFITHSVRIGKELVSPRRCIGWPAPVQNPPHNANMHGAPPILMINAKNDPETSYIWANSLLAQIDGAVLLTRDGDGHTSYILKGDTATVIDVYLVNRTLPAPNTILKT